MKSGWVLGFYWVFVFILNSLRQTGNKEKELDIPVIQPVLVASNLTGPIGLACPNDGSKRLFVLEQKGVIKIIEKGKFLNEPFLTLTNKMLNVRSGYDERGLLGLAFHPDFKRNSRFFVYYSIPDTKGKDDHIGRLSEFKVSPSNPNKAAEIEQVILDIPQPESNHNGGALLFGPDGYLYLGLGDGGGQGDKHGLQGNGQNFQELLGSIIRIDIDGVRPYAIPMDNPYANGKEGRPEVFAKGFRNPWRCSFDMESKRLFCGDVGQNKFEEIDIVEKGKNYGWRFREGYDCYNPKVDCPKEGLTDPIDAYSHSLGISVCGGYVVRNSKLIGLNGLYVCADWNGKIFALKEDKLGKWNRVELIVNHPDFKEGSIKINSMGEDSEKNVYLLTQKSIGPFEKSGKVYRIEVQ